MARQLRVFLIEGGAFGAMVSLLNLASPSLVLEWEAEKLEEIRLNMLCFRFFGLIWEVGSQLCFG